MNQLDIEDFLIKNVKCSSIVYEAKNITLELSLSNEPLLRIKTKKTDIVGLCKPIEIYLIDEKSPMGNILVNFISTSYINGYCFNCMVQNWSEGEYFKDAKKNP